MCVMDSICGWLRRWRLPVRTVTLLLPAGLVCSCVSPPSGGAGGPVDFRKRVPPSAFQRVAPQVWVTGEINPGGPFDELIYSWQIARPGDTFRLQLQVVFAPGDQTDWLPAGYWGAGNDLVRNRSIPKFDRGVLDMDWVKLKAKATGVRFKVVATGTNIPAAPPALTLVATDNHPVRGGGASRIARAAKPPGRVLDVPLRRQFDSQGRRMIDRCQSAALASAMEYFGRTLPLEQITRHTFDVEYNYPGVWPRVIGAAQEFGFDGHIERFRDWAEVRRALAENKMLLCSMRMNPGECQSPPYRSMGNHIVVLCGITDDGRVVVTDSYLGKSGDGRLCQWLQSDFEKVWLKAKGGIAMVILPPKNANARLVADLPPFPKDRAFPVGDDH
jgi:hypothetical protein